MPADPMEDHENPPFYTPRNTSFTSADIGLPGRFDLGPPVEDQHRETQTENSRECPGDVHNIGIAADVPDLGLYFVDSVNNSALERVHREEVEDGCP